MREPTRRTFVAATVGVAAGLAGCTAGDGGGTGTATSTPTPTSTETTVTPRLTGRTFETTGSCSDPETATVAFGDATVTVTGCITGNNGCHEAVLHGVDYDAGGDTLRVDVATEDTSDPDTACTQALVQRGYECRLEFADGLPGVVEVYHKAATESGRVAQVRRDG